MLASVMLRAGEMTANSDLTDFGLEGLDWVINNSEIARNKTFTEDDGSRKGASTDTWSKVNGELFARLRQAVAYLDNTFGIVTTVLPDAAIGTSYSRTLSASGGAVPYLNREIVSGSLPDNFHLAPDTGEISGNPTASGVFTFTVRVADSAEPAATASRALSITVSEPGQEQDSDESSGSGGGGGGGCFISTTSR